MVEEKDKKSASASASAEASADKKATEGKEKKIEVPEKFKDLVAKIEQLSVLDLAELVKILEEKFGVSAQAPVVAAAPVAAEAADAVSAVEEKSIFTIELKEVGDKKIEVIKVVRDVTGKGLKEAKDLVDAAASSAQTVKENSKKEEAEEIKKKLETAGAKVELK